MHEADRESRLEQLDISSWHQLKTWCVLLLLTSPVRVQIHQDYWQAKCCTLTTFFFFQCRNLACFLSISWFLVRLRKTRGNLLNPRQNRANHIGRSAIVHEHFQRKKLDEVGWKGSPHRRECTAHWRKRETDESLLIGEASVLQLILLLAKAKAPDAVSGAVTKRFAPYKIKEKSYGAMPWNMKCFCAAGTANLWLLARLASPPPTNIPLRVFEYMVFSLYSPYWGVRFYWGQR